MMGPGMFDGIDKLLTQLLTVCIVSILVAWPLAIWKVIDIALWIYSHLRWEG